jgi:DNA-binding protein YbaB
MPEHLDSAFASARKVEEAMVAAGEDLAEAIVEGRSEDNKVKVWVTGSFHVGKVRITPGALTEDRIGHLEESVAEAVEAALVRAHGLAAKRVGQALDALSPS